MDVLERKLDPTSSIWWQPSTSGWGGDDLRPGPARDSHVWGYDRSKRKAGSRFLTLCLERGQLVLHLHRRAERAYQTLVSRFHKKLKQTFCSEDIALGPRRFPTMTHGGMQVGLGQTSQQVTLRPVVRIQSWSTMGLIASSCSMVVSIAAESHRAAAPSLVTPGHLFMELGVS